MCRIQDLCQKAKDLGMPAVAITDYKAMYGAFKFFIKAKDIGIKPIIGVEVYKARKSRFDRDGAYGQDQDSLVLLAKDLTGYKNLMQLVTDSNLEGYHYQPRVDFELLHRHKEGVIALSSGLNGEIGVALMQDQKKHAEKLLQQYLDIFGEDFYLELQRHQPEDIWSKFNTGIVELSRKFSIPLVATNDVHYLNSEEAYSQEILLCIKTQRVIFEKNRPLSMIDSPDYYFKTADEMKNLFIDYPEAIENTLKIADKCNLEIPYGSFILPVYDIPDKMTPADYLQEMVYQKIDRTAGHEDSVVKKRIDYELDVIKQKGYSTYFLFVQDFVNWAKEQGIAIGPGRGSAAGSLVAYILKITDINPLDYNIPFERFLNPGRPTPPDIDIDFADARREEVLRYVSNKWGEDKVAQIITFGTMEARMAIRDVARALGMSYSQGDRIAKMMPPNVQGFQMKIDQALEEADLLKSAYSTEDEVKQVIDIVKKVESLPRHTSVHAAGVIIADKKLTEYVPLERDDKENRIITQYDMYCLDLNAVSDNKGVGLLKMDFLGLRNLTIIENAIQLVNKTKGVLVDIHDVPLDDKKTYELLGRGETIGIFQMESGGMRRLAKDMKPSQLTDIAALVALYRPGPMELIPQFLESKQNPKKISYVHPDLEPILKETYGVLVYQEQITEIANKLAGLSMVEADLLRMAMGKKKKALMEKGKVDFINGMVKNGYTQQVASQIFAHIEKFAAYGFNKPHSVCYGLIAYWTAYMKANYPVEYMTSLLTAELEGIAGPIREQKMSQVIEECRRMDIQILSPDINSSEYSFTVEGDSIRFGLSALKNVGKSAIDSIVNARQNKKFDSFRDFLKRVDLRKVNKRTMESLIKSGAMQIFANRATLLHHYPHMVKEIAAQKEEEDRGQFGLFADEDIEKDSGDNFIEIEEYSKKQIYELEREVIGFSLTNNPLQTYKKVIDEKIQKKVGDLVKDDVNQIYVMAGVISSMKVVRTKKDNAEMAFLQVYDDTGAVEIVVFPKTYIKYRSSLNLSKIILFKGKVTNREGALSLMMEKAIDLESTYG
jgi:DNA polymerase-3 subunit alpha